MLSICFEEKIVNFVPARPAGTVAGEVVDAAGLDIAKLLQKFGNHKTVWAVSGDYIALFDAFCALFVQAPAAGGVVSNPHGSVMMIRRNGRWDLPKGHLEPNETPCECAAREAAEECGLQQVECGEFITTTRHAYLLHGRWTLKRCDWFRLSSPADQRPVPQSEEGIEQARWVTLQEAVKLAEDSYLTIQHVLRKYDPALSF